VDEMMGKGRLTRKLNREEKNRKGNKNEKK
jgi:hypothetical protein